MTRVRINTFWRACCLLFLILVSPICCERAMASSYPATIEEGRAAARSMLEQTGASSISVAFVADGGLVWAETFSQEVDSKNTPPRIPTRSLFGAAGLGELIATPLAAAHGTASPLPRLAANDDSNSPIYHLLLRKKIPNTRTMYGIGSVSKMFATVAAMQLVDQGLLDLDEPVTTYLPDFTMLSPEYSDVTVRMLLNHTSGFPGTDYRNATTAVRYPGYLDQVLESLSQEYLKVAPGFMATYCNDGFTVIEGIVLALTGKTFAEYVHDKILTPLGMKTSRYPTEVFAPGTYAPTYVSGEKDPFTVINPFGSGGLYSTPSDMALFAQMFLDGGALGDVRILSEEAVAAIVQDQTQGTFDPAPSDLIRFGLGWDTISQPGLKAVGVTGWSKGGDTGYYGSSFILAPDHGLAAIVSGADHITSGKAATVGERILLRALVEKGVIDEFPQPLPAEPRPLRAPTEEELEAITGHFATAGGIFRIVAETDDTVTMYTYTGLDWVESAAGYAMRDNSWFSSNANPLYEITTIEAGGRTYLRARAPSGYGHYVASYLNAEKIAPAAALSPAWAARSGKIWLVVNDRADILPQPPEPHLYLSTPSGLEGLLSVFTEGGLVSIVDPSVSDERAGMLLVLPQLGRDLNDLFVLNKGGEEWLRFGSFVFRPLNSVPALPQGGETLTIGQDGYGIWRTVAGADVGLSVTGPAAGVCHVYDQDFEHVAAVRGTGNVQLSAATNTYYLNFLAEAGEGFQAALQ